MENETQNLEGRLLTFERKLDAIHESVEKTRKYFLVVMWVTIALVVLPAIGLMFVIPAFINTYMGTLDGLI